MSFFSLQGINYDASDIKSFATQVYNKLGLKLSWDNDVIMAHGKDLPDEALSSNVYILSRKDLEIVATLPTPLTNGVPDDLEDYVICEVQEGSVVTLYYTDGRWRIASSHTTDLSKMSQYGCKITYHQVVVECLLQRGMTFNNLDKNVAYTIGIQHPEYHPHQTQSDLWMIGAYDRAGRQIPVSWSILHNLADIDIPTAKDKCERASSQYMKACMNDLREDFIPTYGYIVVDSLGRRYLMESSLLKDIKNYMYSSEIIKELREMQGKINKVDYCAVRTYLLLDKKHRDLFAYLFHYNMSDVADHVERFCSELQSFIRTKKGTPFMKNTYRKAIKGLSKNPEIFADKNQLKSLVYSPLLLRYIYKYYAFEK